MGLHYDHQTPAVKKKAPVKPKTQKKVSQKLTLTQALDLFCPTYEDLEELKQNLIANMTYVVESIKANHPILATQDEYDAWFCREFGIPSTFHGDYPSLVEVKTEVVRLLIAEAVAEPKRVIGYIVRRQQALVSPKRAHNAITEADIDRAREYPILDLIEGRVFRAGKRHVCHCPFHQEKTPSFYISADNRFKCFGCQLYGDSIAFVMQRDGIKFIEAVKLLNRYAH